MGSTARRAQADREFEEFRRRQQEEMEEQARRFRAQQDAKLKEEDIKSELGGQANEPAGSAREREAEALLRRQRHLEHELDTVNRLLQQKTLTPSLLSPSPPTLARIAVKIKADKPKAWTGEFDRSKRENWIKSAEMYLSSLGVSLDGGLDPSAEPLVFYSIRSLFSDATHEGVCPLQWFDARHARHPFTSPRAVFQAVREHWADDGAADAAWQRYRGARQGSLRAREFGFKLDTLANDVLDQVIGDADRKNTYVAGLNPQVQEFVKIQLLGRKAHKVEEPSFEEVVAIASLTDSLPSFSKKSATSLSSSSSVPKKSSTTYSSSSPAPQASSSSSPSRKTEFWVDQAVAWQAEHPLSTRPSWTDSSGRKPGRAIRCFNCCELGDHYSKACTAKRKDPKVIVMAALGLLSASSHSSPTPSSSRNPSPGTPTALTSVEEISDSESEKE